MLAVGGFYINTCFEIHLPTRVVKSLNQFQGDTAKTSYSFFIFTKLPFSLPSFDILLFSNFVKTYIEFLVKSTTKKSNMLENSIWRTSWLLEANLFLMRNTDIPNPVVICQTGWWG